VTLIDSFTLFSFEIQPRAIRFELNRIALKHDRELLEPPQSTTVPITEKEESETASYRELYVPSRLSQV
jgi:hypothetical protein